MGTNPRSRLSIDRLNQKKGLPAITEMPDARNINIKGEK
jgi:hypothetical protein